MTASIEQQLGDKLRALGATVASAESCSGGLIAHRITNVPGCSAYYLGGAVTYGNRAKMKILGVEKSTLVEHGAVSEPVAEGMAKGARETFGADYAVVTTGIAGPTGGTADKPVGLVYIGVATPESVRVERCQFDGDRESVKAQTAEHALELLVESIG